MKMRVALLLGLAAAELCIASSPLSRQYHFVNDMKNMTEARRYCRKKYTDLATIDSEENMKLLRDMVDLNSVIRDAWIGLYDDVDRWRWSLSDTSFYNDNETEFKRWWFREPDNSKSREHCAMTLNGYWADRSCHDYLPAVCMDVTGPNVTFVFINEEMKWAKAQSYCRQHHTDLASVRNMADNVEIQEVAPVRAWIGLYRDSWKWLDGSNHPFRYWKKGEPDNYSKNEVCVVANFSESGRWMDVRCNKTRAFICHSRPVIKRVIKVHLSRKDSSLDLNDPAVMEQMLEQVRQKLKDQGVNEDVRLSWRMQPDGQIFHKERRETERRKSCTAKDEF